MANLSSAVKKNSGAKHTRKELMSKSPVPWIVLIIISAIAGGFLIYPDSSSWISKNDHINELETGIPILESEKERLSNEKGRLSEDFLKVIEGELNSNSEEKPVDYNQLAEQRFPAKVDTTKVTQIIELYSILMKKQNRGNDIQLNSLGISPPRNVDGMPYAESSMSINIVIDRAMLEEFIAFLQTGEITNKLENQVIKTRGGESASIEFLTLNKLPVATINSLSLNEERGSEDSVKEIYNAQIQVLLYSEPI